MPGSIGLKLLGFARTRIQRYVPPAANNLAASNSALPPSWQQAAEEPLVWQQAEPDSEPLTPVMDQPEVEAEPVQPQQTGFAPDLLRMLEMHEEHQADEGDSADSGTPQNFVQSERPAPTQPSAQTIRRKPRADAPERNSAPPPRPRTPRPEQASYQPPEMQSYGDESFSEAPPSNEPVVRPPSGVVHEIIQPKRPRPTLRPPTADAPESSAPQQPTIQRQAADEAVQPETTAEPFDIGYSEPEVFSQAPDTYFETELPEQSQPHYDAPAPEIRRAVQNDAPAPSAPQAPNPYFPVSGIDEEGYGDTEPIAYPQETIQRKPAPPTQPVQPSAPNIPPARPTPRLDAIQRSVESVEKNLEVVQRNLDNIQRFVDGGKPAGDKAPPSASARAQTPASQPGYSQMDAPRQELVYGFDDEMPDATTPYTPVQVNREMPAEHVNRSAAEPDAPAMDAAVPYDTYSDAPEATYQDYTDYSAATDENYPTAPEAWSTGEQDNPVSFDPPATTDYPTQQPPAPRQAPRQIVQAKRVPVNRPLQRSEDYSHTDASEPEASYEQESYSSVPESGSAEADLLQLLNLPSDTPVAGLKQPATPNAPNTIRRKPAASSSNNDNAWQGDIDISEPYNEAEADEDDDYTPLPNQIQPVSLDQVLSSNVPPGRSSDTPIQRAPDYSSHDDEDYGANHMNMSSVSLDEALLSNSVNDMPLQRAETSAPTTAATPSGAAAPNGANGAGQQGGDQNSNVDKLAREVYRLLRDKLRIEQERRSDKS